MTSTFALYFEDALNHSTQGDVFDTYKEAKIAFDKAVEAGPEGYDLAVELIELDEDEEMIEHDFHEWFTQEEWETAHPTGFPS